MQIKIPSKFFQRFSTRFEKICKFAQIFWQANPYCKVQHIRSWKLLKICECKKKNYPVLSDSARAFCERSRGSSCSIPFATSGSSLATFFEEFEISGSDISAEVEWRLVPIFLISDTSGFDFWSIDETLIESSLLSAADCSFCWAWSARGPNYK